jgi:transcriptional regulator with XRE-family HTH domain/tetratricopeptide (TPR) repeat protein
MESNRINDILSFGGWVQSRREALRMSREDLAKKVGCAAITIKKIERGERKPSSQVAELLANHLIIPIALREEFMQMARGNYVSSPKATQVILQYPRFLTQNRSHVDQDRSPFVGRDAEIERLEAYLTQALDQRGLPIFVVGEAGSGKTTLITEFSQRAQRKYSDLLVVSGQCNAQSGVGDPYRPFRDMLGALSGGIESSLAIGRLDHEQALRIWSSIPNTIRALSKYGPNLTNLFLSKDSLVRRFAPYVTGPVDWLDRLQAIAPSDESAQTQWGQDQVLEEMTQVLKALSVNNPLLLFIDDLQWVDDASKNLLFHLGRRLTGSRILLVCACRSDALVVDRTTEQANINEEYCIQSLLLELSRVYGDIQIKLDQPERSDGRAFIDALLDTESNNLDKRFRETLLRYTQGQPLFTVEVLRNLQEHRNLVRDHDGKWIVNSNLDSLPIPARIEAVIAQRLSVLSFSLRDLLNVASVEGDQFTAEIIANILGSKPELVLRNLSQDLEKRYRLIEDQGEVAFGASHLNRFKFRHVLFQEYVYDQLPSGEKRRLHRAIAEEIEKLLWDDDAGELQINLEGIETLGSALVHHFSMGEAWGKMARYAFQMGKRARKKFAMREAIHYFEQALHALRQLPEREELETQVYDAILSWEEAAYKFVPYDQQLQRLAQAEAIARKEGDKPRLIQALHWIANVFLSRGLWTRAGPALTECLALADELGKEELSVRPVFFKALMTTFVNPPASLGWFDRALELSRKYADLHIEAIVLGFRAQILAQIGDFPGSQTAIDEAWRVATHLGSPLTESDVDLEAAQAALAMGHFEQALALGQRSVDTAIATDNMDCICSGLACIGYANLELRLLQAAASGFERGIERSEILGAVMPLLNAQAGLAAIHFMNGDTSAAGDLEDIMSEMHRYGNEVGAANASLMLGTCLLQTGDLSRAETYLNQAVDYYRQAKMQPFLAKALITLSELLKKTGRYTHAQECRAEVDELL